MPLKIEFSKGRGVSFFDLKGHVYLLSTRDPMARDPNSILTLFGLSCAIMIVQSSRRVVVACERLHFDLCLPFAVELVLEARDNNVHCRHGSWMTMLSKADKHRLAVPRRNLMHMQLLLRFT